MSTKKFSERDIFGGSDSELSSDEDDLPPSRAVAAAQVSEEEESDDDDNYKQVEEKSTAPRKKRGPRRSRREGVDGEAPARKKRKAVAYTEQELETLTPDQQRKYRLEQQIDNILKSKKTRKTKRKKDEDDLDEFADAEVNKLREDMLAAAEEDIRLNSEKQTASTKFRMLPRVMETLQKAALTTTIIDNGLLDGVRRWLEPLPDRSLPSLNIQRAFFGALTRMYIDTPSIKESRLGPLILFYTKCRRVTDDIRRQAEALLNTWTRPILKNSSSFRERVNPTASAPTEKRQESLAVILARAKANDTTRNVRRNAVTIPQREFSEYTVVPQSNASKANTAVDIDNIRRKQNNDRLRALTRKIQKNKI